MRGVGSKGVFGVKRSSLIIPILLIFLSAGMVTLTSIRRDVAKEAYRAPQINFNPPVPAGFLAEVFQENIRLRKLLAFKESFSYELVPAQVIGRDPTNWFNTLLINRGSNSGIEKNMAVITPQGLVGRLMEVAPLWSRVLLILDQRSSVAALVQRSRVQGVVEGGWKLCHMNYLGPEADIREGDLIVTSGLEGGFFPKGLLIGEVTRISQVHSGLLLSAEVEPQAEFAKLEEVLVIKCAKL